MLTQSDLIRTYLFNGFMFVCHLLHNAWLGRVKLTAIVEDPYMEIKGREEG